MRFTSVEKAGDAIISEDIRLHLTINVGGRQKTQKSSYKALRQSDYKEEPLSVLTHYLRIDRCFRSDFVDMETL
jgi:hypothetical protein